MPDETASGIRTADDGSRFVGGTVRADGSVRKAVKVRPGFVPLEDVAKYVPRARRIGTEGEITQRSQTRSPRTVASSSGRSLEIGFGKSGTKSPRNPQPTTPTDELDDDLSKALSTLAINNDPKPVQKTDKGIKIPAKTLANMNETKGISTTDDKPQYKKPDGVESNRTRSSPTPKPTTTVKTEQKTSEKQMEAVKPISNSNEDKTSRPEPQIYVPPWKRKQQGGKS